METKKGFRCRVCTGCGLCPGVPAAQKEKLHVLADEISLQGESLSRALPKGKRLVTIDIGTTTVAALLYDMEGKVCDRVLTVNPQAVYGAEVISRILAAGEEQKAQELKKLITTVLENNLRRFAAKISEGETLFPVIAANTTMNYLLLGHNPEELGHAPFHAAYLDEECVEIASVKCLVMPGISAFVGADIMAGMLACEMADRAGYTLLIDLGTNGEMALGNREGIVACATAAGPAFEGGANKGMYGSDMISLLATLRREGLVDEDGALAEDYLDRGVKIGNVTVTTETIRSLQLAKAAIATGIEVLFERRGITAKEIERVVLAGGFGYYLRPEDAAEIGLLPSNLVEKTIPGGNTALLGARVYGAFSHGEALQKTDEIKNNTESINLAEMTHFRDSYLSHFAMVPFEV